MPTKRESLVCFAAYLFISSFALAQSIPLPPDAEQLSVWTVSYPEWSESWETALDRCGIDDPTLYRVIRLVSGAASVDIRTANKQIQELDRRIIDDLKKHGWSQMKVGSSGRCDRRRCFQKGESFVQIRDVCAYRSCTAYDGLTLVYYLEIPPR